MRVLLDSHALIWWLSSPERLSETARMTIARGEIVVHVSVATIWELAIKMALGRLRLDDGDMTTVIRENGFTELPIVSRHAIHAAALPPHHHDPFDRLLIAQAQIEGLVLVSADAEMRRYDAMFLD